jgi:hypothetical protein
MDDRQTTLLADLRGAAALAGQDWQRSVRRSAWLAEWSQEDLAAWLNAAADLFPLPKPADKLLAHWLLAAQRQQPATAQPTTVQPLPAELLDAIERLYDAVGPASRARGPLLAWLAASRGQESLALLGRLLTDDPPREDQDVVQALAPLFQHRRGEAAALFPGLLGALAHPALAAPVLDLANFLTREGLVPRHPAADQSRQLTDLLGNLVQSLQMLEERPQAQGGSPQEISRQVAQGVALAVSLCDALALIGERQAIGKLRQTLALRHRRVRTEAAAALARLGEAEGQAELIQLAAQPVARLRVLAYAKELGILDQIEPEFQTPLARAEAELCVWLAEPTQYGVPPAACELYDQRRCRWPGYSEPVDCFLFRFLYVVTVAGEGERSFSNIGIAGPATHAVVADLSDLPPDDIYALFAGWQAQHEEIREFEVSRLSKSEQLEVERLKRRLHDEGFSRIEPQRMGYFFGEKALVALAHRQGVPGVAVADFQQCSFFPSRHSRRPLGPDEAYNIYKGRKLLATFNPQP